MCFVDTNNSHIDKLLYKSNQTNVYHKANVCWFRTLLCK